MPIIGVSLVHDWWFLDTYMPREEVRFGVELDRKTDGEFREIAAFEDRSKSSMHRVLIRRIVKLWKEDREGLEKLGLIQRGH